MFAAARANRFRRQFRLKDKKPTEARSQSTSSDRPGSSASNRSASSTPTRSRRSSSTTVCSATRKREAVTAIELPLGLVLGLKISHLKGIKMTWSKLYDPVRPGAFILLIERVFEKLRVKQPTIKSIFVSAAFMDWKNRRTSGSGTTVRDHAKLLIGLLDRLVKNIDKEPTETLNFIDSVGRSHTKLRPVGFKSKFWEQVGEAFIDVIIVHETVRAYPEGTKAWTILIASLTDRLNAAFNQRIRNSSRHKSLIKEEVVELDKVSINGSVDF